MIRFVSDRAAKIPRRFLLDNPEVMRKTGKLQIRGKEEEVAEEMMTGPDEAAEESDDAE